MTQDTLDLYFHLPDTYEVIEGDIEEVAFTTPPDTTMPAWLLLNRPPKQ